ncbi:hypothetical protein ES703_70518 [subsurface metagenome]
MAGKLLQQFKVGKTKPNRLDTTKNLVPTGSENLFRFIQNELIRPNQLHSVLGFWHLVSRISHHVYTNPPQV